MNSKSFSEFTRCLSSCYRTVHIELMQVKLFPSGAALFLSLGCCGMGTLLFADPLGAEVSPRDWCYLQAPCSTGCTRELIELLRVLGELT